MQLTRKPDRELQPGDIFTNVPFNFPLPEDELIEAASDGLYRRVKLADVEQGLPRALAVVERRLVFAMLHPFTPACEIDKMIPPNGSDPKRGEDQVLTFFHCRTKEELGPIWGEKLKHNDRHIRIAPIGEIEIAQGKSASLAVMFRRDQQILNHVVKSLTRVASLTDEGRQVVVAAYEIYLRS